VYSFTKLHDRRIPKVGVVVGPMEFQLNTTAGECIVCYSATVTSAHQQSAIALSTASREIQDSYYTEFMAKPSQFTTMCKSDRVIALKQQKSK